MRHHLLLGSSLIAATLLAPACGQYTTDKRTSVRHSAASGSELANGVAFTSTTSIVSAHIDALVVVDDLNTGAPLHGATAGFDGGSIGGTGPNGGTKVTVSFTDSVTGNGCTSNSADLCATASGYFKQCTSESVSVCGSSGSTSKSVNVRFRQPQIGRTVGGYYRDLFGRAITADEEASWVAKGRSRTAASVASELLNSPEGRQARIVRFFTSFTPAGSGGLAYTDADVQRGLKLFAKGHSELQVFTALLQAQKRKAAVLSSGAYLRTIVAQNYSLLLHRTPKKSEINAALATLAKNHAQVQITLNVASGDEYLHEQ